MTLHERLGERLGAVEATLNDRLPSFPKVGFLTLYVHTGRADALVDAVADRGPWGRWHDACIVALALVMVAALGTVTGIASMVTTRDVTATAANQANNVPAIPGVNDFMPLAATPSLVVASLVATVAYEGGHAVAMRHEDVPIEELGVALL